MPQPRTRTRRLLERKFLSLNLLQWSVLAYGAVAVFAGLWWLLTEPSRWNHIGTQPETWEGEIALPLGHYKTTLYCDCPVSVIEGSSDSVTFTLTAKREKGDLSATGEESINAGIDADAGTTPLELKNAGVVLYGKPDETSETQFTLMLRGVKPDLSRVNIRLYYNPPDPKANTIYFDTWRWGIHPKPTFYAYIAPDIYAAGILGILLSLFFWVNRKIQRANQRTQDEVLVASTRAHDNPQVAKFAWDAARVKLEAYFDRNLIQVNLVFWVACCVMAVGFLFVLAGVRLVFISPDSIKPSLVAAASGIITQFIGATFMVIYRSTMAQATAFMTVLERINTVGMAVQIVDSLKDESELKERTRAELATLLLTGRPAIRASANASRADKERKPE